MIKILLIVVAVLEFFAATSSILGLIRLRKERSNPRGVSGRFLITLGAVLFGIAGSIGLFITLTG